MHRVNDNYSRKILFCLPVLLLLASAFSAFSQSIEPVDLARKIFSGEPFPDIDRYISGDYHGHPNGSDLQHGVSIHFLLLDQSAEKAVVAMAVVDSSGQGLDAYLHFEKDTIWKMHACRALAMTGIIEQVKEQLEKMTAQEVDAIIDSSGKKNSEGMRFASRQDYYEAIGNARLTLALDDTIIKHFLINKPAFERLKAIALKEVAGTKPEQDTNTKLLENEKKGYGRLFISGVSYGDYELGGKCLNFLIGGMLDNTVGYLYVSDKNDLPEMSDSRVIMLREIGNGWYIYKTT